MSNHPRIITTLSLLFFVSGLFGQNNRPDALSAAFGGSLVTQSRNATALFWNPANLSGLKDRAILLSVHDPFEFNFIAINQVVPTYGTFALSLSRFSTGADSVDRGTVAWGRSLSRWFSVGTNLNIDKQDKALFASGGVGFFLGNPVVGVTGRRWRSVKYPRTLDQLNLGLIVNNVPLGDNLFDMSAMFGASYLFPAAGLLFNFGYHFNKGENTNHLGLGFELNQHLSIHVGIQDTEIKQLGFGLDYRRDDLSVQAAYRPEIEKLLLTLSTRIGLSPEALAAPHYKQGTTYLHQRHFKRASREFKKYLSYEPAGTQADSVRQLIYALDRRVARTQFLVDSLFAASQKLLAQGEPQFLRAALILNRINELDPDNTLAIRQLQALKPVIDVFVKKSLDDGMREFDMNRYTAAKKQFKRAIVFDPENGTAQYYLTSIDKVLAGMGEEYFYKGIEFYRKKQYAKAQDEFIKALDHNPGLSEANSYLNRTKERLEQRKERLEQLIIEAQKLERRKQFVEATNKLLDVLKQDPGNVMAKNMMDKLRPKTDRYVNQKYAEANRSYQQGNFEEAAEMYKHILSIDPSHTKARNSLTLLENERENRVAFHLAQAESFNTQRQWEKAIDQYANVLQVDPGNKKALDGKTSAEKKIEVSGLIVQGRRAYDAANYPQAIHVFENILEVDPNNQAARSGLAAARNQVNKLVEEYFNRGIDLYTLDKYQESIKVLNKVLELDPKHNGALEYIRQARERITALKKIRN